MATINEIKQQAAAVKNASQMGENTAERVGGVLAGLAEIAEQQDSKLIDLSSSLLANTPCLYTDNAELNKILKYCHVSKKESVGDFSFSLYSSGAFRINLQNNTPIQIGINKCYNNTLYYNDGNILILMVFDWSKITSNILNVKFTENAFCKLDAIGDKTIAEINSHHCCPV